MAIAELIPHPELINPWIVAAGIISAAVGLVSFLITAQRLSWPEKTPKVISEWPLLGSWGFWNARWDFHRDAANASKNGTFGYHVGKHSIIGTSGDKSRKAFFESKKLDLSSGYATLLAGAPGTKPDVNYHDSPDGEDLRSKFAKTLVTLVKKERLHQNLETLIKDTRMRLDDLAADPSRITNPFFSIYEIVFQLTMRMVGATEIADDKDACRKMLRQYELVEGAGTPLFVMFPWLPTPSMFKRLWGGSQIFMTFDKLVKARKANGYHGNDAMQYQIDRGDSTTDIITFTIGSLFAGLLNSGINAAWMLLYLGKNPQWRTACQRELDIVADRYAPDKSQPLPERLAHVPLEAWEGEFPVAEACLRECIRMVTPGAFMRKNISGTPVTLPDGSVVPPDFFVTYHVADVHFDPEIYPDPGTWDPSRYVNLDGTPAAEPQGVNKADSEKNYRFVGWGAARHPCLGMRFAKMEMNVILAFWLAYFDFDVLKPEKGIPRPDMNTASAAKAKEEILIRYWPAGSEKPT